MLAPGIERERAREREAGGVFGVDARALTQRRHRRADNAFGKSFLVDIGDVENFETAGTVRGIKVFAAQNDVLDVVAAVFVRFGKHRAAIDMFFVVRRIGDLVQMTADYGLRLVGFGPNHGVKSVASFADISVAPKEIYSSSSEA